MDGWMDKWHGGDSKEGMNEKQTRNKKKGGKIEE